jgi:hypothetical protein
LPDDVDIEQLETGAVMDYAEYLPDFRNVRKLDSTGKELLSLDIGEDTRGTLWSEPFNFDAHGNLYIGRGDTIEVLDQGGSLLFDLSIQGGHGRRLLKMPDGGVVFSEHPGITLREIDVANGTWGKTVFLPPGMSMPFPGNEEFPILCSDGVNLIAYNPETDEIKELMNWVNSGFIPEEAIDITLLEDGRIILTTVKREFRGFTGSFNITTITRVPFEELTGITLLTLAAYHLDPVTREAVIAFNRGNDKYFVQVIDYAVYDAGSDEGAGFTRLTLDLSTGRIPDMLAIVGMPQSRYASRGSIPIPRCRPGAGLGRFVGRCIESQRDWWSPVHIVPILWRTQHGRQPGGCRKLSRMGL